LKTETDEQANAALTLARERWAEFPGERQVMVEELMFVRENGGCWQDVAPVAFGTRPIVFKVA
jgi:hypothetical protein